MIEAYGQLDMTQTPSVGVAGPDTIVKIPDLNVLNVYILPTYFLLDEAYGRIGKGTRLYSGDCRFESCYALPFLGKC